MNTSEQVHCDQVNNMNIFQSVGGFDDNDLEKPNFPGKSVAHKIPYVLSAPSEIPVVQVPATINQYLRKYQQVGITFLYKQYSSGKGAILADDMGLGKTVQVIGFISAVLGKTGTKSDIYGEFLHPSKIDKNNEHLRKNKGAFLIVSPHSVLYNWLDELDIWGYFKVGKFHKNKREETLEKASKNKLDVVLTTYETLRNHWESLNQVHWLALIMDEVHHLKDPKTAVTNAAKSLNVKCRIGLTGTPLQNRILEFWCVLDWANPGCLGQKEDFTHQFGKPIMQGQRFDVNKRELATGRKKTQEFQTMINEWCLRRTKSLISDQLPTKDQKVVFCPLTKLQEDIYKTLLQTQDVQLILRQSEPCDCRSGLSRGHCCYYENEEGVSMKQLTLQYLRLLLKVSNHAALLLPPVKQTEGQRKRAAAICEKVFSSHPDFEEASKLPSIELFSDSSFCGKMKVLDQLLKLFQRQKDKVLLFSYSTQLLDILESYVISCGMVYRRLDGKTRGEQRIHLVREFNTVSGIFLFLISTKVGGVGINLTSANVVVVFDPSWNPADDLQAEDRAYRIGQRKDVKVFRMISSGTVEENMYLRQIYKQQIANVAVEGNNERRYFTGVEGEKDKKGELFGIENLFALRNDGCCISNDIFTRSDSVERGFKMAKYQLQPQGINTKSCVTEDCDEDGRYDLDNVASQITHDKDIIEDNKFTKEFDEEVMLNNTGRKISDVSFVQTTENDKKNVEFTKVRPITGESDVRKRCEKKRTWKKHKNLLKKTPSSNDSEVNEILADCGVQHTHSNKLIIGTSKAENEMTARAIKEVFELGQSSQQPANCFTASDSEESDDIGGHEEIKLEKYEHNDSGSKKDDLDKSSTSESVENQGAVSKVGDTSVLFGKTPKAIRLRQFCGMAHSQGYESEIDFAKDVLSSSTTDRVDLLKKYYESNDYPVQSFVHYSCQASLKIKNKSKTQQRRKSSKNVLSSKFSRRCRSSKRFNTILNRPTKFNKVVKESLIDPKNNGNKNTILHSLPFTSSVNNTSENVVKDKPKIEYIGTDHMDNSNKPRVGESVKVSKNLSSAIIQNIEDNKQQNRCNEDKTTASSDIGDLTTLTTRKDEEEQSSCFLDVFLYECSQQNQSQSGKADNKKDVVRLNSKNVYTNIQSSVFDDLI